MTCTVWVTVDASAVMVTVGACPVAKTVVVRKDSWRLFPEATSRAVPRVVAGAVTVTVDASSVNVTVDAGAVALTNCPAPAPPTVMVCRTVSVVVAAQSFPLFPPLPSSLFLFWPAPAPPNKSSRRPLLPTFPS